MKSSPPKYLLALVMMACLILPPARTAASESFDLPETAAVGATTSVALTCMAAALAGAEPHKKNQIEALLCTNGLEITRSVIQPLRRFSGERMELNTSVGNTVKEKFYGVIMILKYQVKQASLARSMTFTEKVYLVIETHDFGTWKYYERSWSPDEQGVWTDALGLGDETPLPADYKRVLRQELYCNSKLFANNLITFTPDSIEFQPMNLDAGRRVRRKNKRVRHARAKQKSV